MGAEEPEGLESSKSCQEGENLLVFCRNVGFAFPRVKSSPEQGVPSTRVTAGIPHLPPGINFTPSGLILLPEEWLNSRSAGSSPGRAGAGPQHCRSFAANSSYKRHQDFFFHGFPLSGAGSAELHPWSYFLMLLRLDEVVVMV